MLRPRPLHAPPVPAPQLVVVTNTRSPAMLALGSVCLGFAAGVMVAFAFLSC